MPLFAKLFMGVASALVSFFAIFFEMKVAAKLAAYTLWITMFTALLVSVFICVQNIFGYINVWMVSGPAWLSFFMMGVGMFIPSNASALMTCQGSIWIATAVYKMQKQGIMNFGS
jgi:hypothetical protein